MTDTTGATVPGETGTTTGTTTTAMTTTQPWYEGASSEEVGYLQNRGWDKLEPKAVALAASRAHREAEKLIGAPADKIVRLPRDASDVEGLANLYAKLGVPTDDKGYDFSSVKHADGTALDEVVTTELGRVLRSAGVAKDRAPDIAKAIVALDDKKGEARQIEQRAALDAQRETLKINWGANIEANLVIARNAAAALGIKPEAVAALEGQIGYAAVMEMFRSIGTKIGEDRFVSGGAGGSTGNGPMSVDQARATLDSRIHDAEWSKKLSNGDPTTLREFDNLTRVVSGTGRG